MRRHEWFERTILSLAGVVRKSSLCSRVNGTWLRFPLSTWPGIRRRYEVELAPVLTRLLREGDTFIDVGAHAGIWSAFAARRVGSTGRVVAVEPGPAFDRLSDLPRVCPQVRCVRTGVGDAAGTATFYSQGQSTSAAFVETVTRFNSEGERGAPIVPTDVPMTTLDALVSELGLRPTVIKVDVEGYEVKVLRGASRLLEEGRACWVIEVHRHQMELSGDSEQELRDVLSRSGHRIEELTVRKGRMTNLLAYGPRMAPVASV